MYRLSLVTLLVAGVVALAVPDNEARSTKSDTPADKQGAKSTSPAIKLSGSGDEASAKFKLQGGLSTWQISHSGRSNFQVSLLSSDGKNSDMPINEIGKFKGTQAVRVAKAGEYLLNVKADGKWAITIEQPKPDAAPAKPMAITGTGPSVSPFVFLRQGINTFKVTHRGDSVFRVKILDLEGKLIEQVVGVIGAYEGSKAVTLEEEGIYLINIYANGEWSLKID